MLIKCSTQNKRGIKKYKKRIKEKAFFTYKIDIKSIDKHAKDFDELSFEDQKRFLNQRLDKNHLYVNYSEIEAEEYKVGEEDKELNREFYEVY